MPLHYGDHNAYQMVCGYRRKLDLGEELAGKRLFLQFDGAAHIATVYVNGQELTTHCTGYTAFRVEITE
jgi:beta-galactosidase